MGNCPGWMEAKSDTPIGQQEIPTTTTMKKTAEQSGMVDMHGMISNVNGMGTQRPGR